jgi:hypothetical protein
MNKIMNSMLFGKKISRRRFLELSGKAVGYSALASAMAACSSGGNGGDSNPDIPGLRIPAPSSEYSVLRRTSFGVSRQELTRIEKMGISAYLDEQLDYENIDTTALEGTISSLFPDSGKTPSELRPGFPDNFAGLVSQLVSATQYRAFFSPRQLYEVMVEFWSNHFSIQVINGLEPILKPYDDASVIRPHALGNFRDMLHASAKSSAMVYYLDNFLNFKDAPNENYARELLELHSMGVDGGYTEQDIKEVARCFTGWTLDFATGEFLYNDALHDKNEKTVLGQSINFGDQRDGEAVLDLICYHPSTAQFIATRLCTRFISDTPSSAVMNHVANVFISSSGDIKSTLRALFDHQEFLQTYDQKLCRPMEFMGQYIRLLNPGLALPQDNGQLNYLIISVLGQSPFFWPTPDGYPDSASYWGSTSGLLNRWRIALSIGFGDLYPLTDLIDNENTPETIVNRLANEVLLRPMHDSDRQLLIDYIAELTNLAPSGVIPNQYIPDVVKLVTSLLLSSVYFQLR